MAKERFERKRSYPQVGMIGQVDNDKRELVADTTTMLRNLIDYSVSSSLRLQFIAQANRVSEQNDTEQSDNSQAFGA